MKKIYMRWILFSALASLVFSCTKQEEPSNKITIWAWDPYFNIAIMEEAKSRYLQKNPDIEFEIVEMPKAGLEQKLLTNLSSGITSELPDIVLIEDYNAQKYLRSFPGSFADLTDEIDYSGFLPYKRALATVDGRTYSMPFDTGTSALFYRSDYLAAAGYSEEDLENITWDQFIQIGKNVKEATGKYLLSMDFSNVGLLSILLQSAGTWYSHDDGSPNLENNEVLAEALEVYKGMYDADIALQTSGWASWVGAFNSGDVATVTTGVWIIGTIKSEASQSGKWRVAPTPRLANSSSVNASNSGGSSWYVLETAQNKVLAIDFLNTVYGQDVDFYQKILVDRGAFGSFIPATKGASYSTADAFFGGQKVFEKMALLAQNIPSVNYGAYTYEYMAGVIAELPRILNGDISIQAALKNAQEAAVAQMQ